ncbi:MAG: UPF0182 family protein [Candidatus Altiarchaeota archaeon]|nr:UPF0182 family protein [Candidatus Altiarchaeota archaeon]
MKNKTQIILMAIILVVMVILPATATIYTDYIWYHALGYESVYLTMIYTALGLFLATGVVSYIIFTLNLYLADRKTGSYKKKYMLALIAALLVALTVSSSWETVLKYQNQAAFNQKDPIFQQDISFYLFTLPLHRLVQNMLIYITVLSIIGVLLVYLKNQEISLLQMEQAGDAGLLSPGMQLQITGLRIGNKARKHLYVLAGVFFLVLTWKHHLDRYNILYSESGVIYGASYADVNAFLPALSLLIFTALVTGILLFISAIQKHRKKPDMWGMALGAVALYVMVLSVGTGLYPSLIQQYKVQPNEYVLEEEYIKHNIQYTRQAYNLQEIQEKDITPVENASIEHVTKNRDIVENIRLWDWRPLKQTYKQLQEIRSYYDFNDVDVDRYKLDNRYTQVMLSAREMNTQKLSSEAQTWVNTHLLYTHGYGVCMSPVNEYTEGGLPIFYIKDIPPQTEIPEIEVKRPEIYYGENTNNFVLVKTNTQEFDYPMGDQNKYVTYEGNGGVPLGSFLDQVMLALRFGDINLILSEYINPESRIMFKRSLKERVNGIAPFLAYDPDPYIINSEGRLYWIIDAYTYTSSYPYSTPNAGLNYIRNPVKVVIDAYNGDTTYYVIDDEDPIIKTYQNMFPELFKPFKQMPEHLRGHIRYPEILFSIQADIYGIYHMTDPQVFYNKEDKWVIPNEIYGQGNKEVMDPYYIITKLPGEENLQFILMTPLTPRSRDNMIAWMAAKCDQPDYGDMVIYKFPKEKLIYGPMQIEARVDQNDEISQQLTLWSQRGSYVIRGNLLVIPVEDTLLYIEPLYIQAEKATMPELKRIIVSYKSRVVMEKTLEEAFRKLFIEEPREKPPEIGDNRTIEELIDLSVENYNRAQEHLREGNWSGFGWELDELEVNLRKMQNRSSG